MGLDTILGRGKGAAPPSFSFLPGPKRFKSGRWAEEAWSMYERKRQRKVMSLSFSYLLFSQVMGSGFFTHGTEKTRPH